MAFKTAVVYFSLCLSILAGNAFCREECHPKPTDVIFVLDTSESIDEQSYRKQINFVSNFVRDLKTLSSTGTEIGIYTFSDSFKNNVILGQYQDKNSLLSLLNGIQRLGGSTNTHLVLEDILKNGFKTSYTQNAKQVVILITDGQSVFPSKTFKAAKALHSNNIEVHTVGVGSDVDLNELQKIASSLNYTHHVPNYNELKKIRKDIDKLVCNNIIDPMKPKRVCITRPTDVIFALDSSDSISQQDFDIQINFIVDTVNDTNMKISANESQVGIYTFATGFVLNINLGMYNSKASLLKAIKSISRIHGSTNTHLVLNDVLQTGFSRASGARTGVHRAVVLITDGRSVYDKDTVKAADALHNNKIEVIAIGVGNDTSKSELKHIASKYEQMHLVANYRSLKVVLQHQITKITCVNKPICKVRPTDVIFAIDSSSSISTDDFAMQQRFLVSFVNNTKLVIGDSNVRIGLYLFAGTFTQIMQLNSFKTKADIINALNNLVQLQGFTNTHLVLRDILTNGFSASSGARANAHHVVVLITDGQSVYRKETIKAGKALHQAGIEVYAISVGTNTDDTELEEVASTNKTFFSVPDYNTLDLIEDNVNKVICTDTSNQNGSNTNTSSCPAGSADVVFLMDTSDSTGKKDLSMETKIVSEFVNSMTGRNNIRVALITFATKPIHQLSLTSHTSKSVILSLLQNLQVSSGSTNTAGALKFAKTNLQQSRNTRQVVVLITDGKSDDLFYSLQAAEDLRSSGIIVFGYGIKNSDISELQLISGSMENVIIGEIPEVSKQLKSKILNSKCS